MPADKAMAIQLEYEKPLQVCYGCGALNAQGLQLKSYRDGERVVAEFRPDARHTGLAGYVYGGLIASLMDCHAMATAAAHFSDRDPNSKTAPRMVTAALKVKYLKPTPLGDDPLRLTGIVVESSESKAVVAVELGAGGKVTATGEVVAVRLPEEMRV